MIMHPCFLLFDCSTGGVFSFSLRCLCIIAYPKGGFVSNNKNSPKGINENKKYTSSFKKENVHSEKGGSLFSMNKVLVDSYFLIFQDNNDIFPRVVLYESCFSHTLNK